MTVRWPRISIITPSFNQGHYLEATILSVIQQNYPNLEYIIIDGGSTDNSIEVIQRYASQVSHWVSEPDRGQAHAINKGFARSTGDILGWLNSDDLYLPDTLTHVSQHIDIAQAEIVCGNTIRSKDGTLNGFRTNILRALERSKLILLDTINQPSAFWTRQAWQRVGHLNESMHFAFDWEWFIRAEKAGVRFKPDDKALSIYRIHANQKTQMGGGVRQQEILRVYQTFASPIYDRLIQVVSAQQGKRKVVEAVYRRFGVRSRSAMMMARLCFPKLAGDYNPADIIDAARMLT